MNNLLIIFTQMIGTATISVHNNLCVTLSIIGVTICSIRAKKRLAYTNNDNNRLITTTNQKDGEDDEEVERIVSAHMMFTWGDYKHYIGAHRHIGG